MSNPYKAKNWYDIRMSAITKWTSILKHNTYPHPRWYRECGPDTRGMGHTSASNARPHTEAQTFESISRERLQWNLILIYVCESKENLKYFLSWTIWCADP